MRLEAYLYEGVTPQDFKFSEITLQHVNLFVGESGSGKTKLLNTIFNIAQRIRTDGRIGQGSWKLTCESEGTRFRWEVSCAVSGTIESERILSSSNGEEMKLVAERQDEIQFNGVKLPRLASDTSLITLLKEEEQIAPLFHGLGKITRRNFFSAELENSAAIGAIPPGVTLALEQEKKIEHINAGLPLSVRLSLLKEYFPEKYQEITRYFQSVFASIESCEVVNFSTLYPEQQITNLGKAPVFSIKEKNVDHKIGLHELSSGMQKVLLMLTDIISMPTGHIYLIDEYENSLGVNAIHFLPDFLAEYGETTQFIVTTHHPYLINAIPVRDWYVFKRSGNNVSIRFGEDIQSKFGTSRQKAFVQLINDPTYSGDGE